MALSAAITDLAARIKNDIQGGTGTRANVGVVGDAFGWVGGGLPVTMASFCPGQQAAGLTVPVTRIALSGTPPTVVAEGTAKPSAVAITSENATLSKHAGYGQFSTEMSLNTPGISAAITSVLGAGLLLSFEAEAMAALAADNGADVSAATWITAIVEAQGKVLGLGGSPGLLVMSSVAWAALVGELANGAGFSVVPNDGSVIGSFLGSVIHISPKLATGAYVLDPGACVAYENENGPLIVTDIYSQASVNKVNLYSEVFASLYVSNPEFVIPVTKSVLTTGSRD